MMLRKVNLPHAVTGRLYLSGLPGRKQRFADALREMADEDIDIIVCLAEIAEVEREAPEYAAAIEVRSLPSAHHWFSIPDGGVPKDETAFVRMLMELVERLRNGSRTLVHCRAGFGRSGTAAVCALLLLGVPVAHALELVDNAGSGPETSEQEAFIDSFAAFVRASGSRVHEE